MRKKNPIVLSVCCGVITCGLHFYLIPQFFMRGLPDPVWGILMILFPIIPAVVLLYTVRQCPPKSILWSLLAECFIVLVFHRAIGGFLGYHLYSLEWDLFEYIAYFMFTFGLAIPTALIQFIVLFVLNKYKQLKKL